VGLGGAEMAYYAGRADRWAEEGLGSHLGQESLDQEAQSSQEEEVHRVGSQGQGQNHLEDHSRGQTVEGDNVVGRRTAVGSQEEDMATLVGLAQALWAALVVVDLCAKNSVSPECQHFFAM
jgi:hypothetical protein